jgi:hypothetical protein
MASVLKIYQKAVPPFASFQVPVIATLLELDGRVIFQNGPSKNYWGILETQAHTSNHTSASLTSHGAL